MTENRKRQETQRTAQSQAGNPELPYDGKSKESILRYALNLRDSTLRQSSSMEALDDMRRNKGSFGNAIERYFALDSNNDSVPDFKDAGLELKTTPLKQTKDGRIVAKERLVLGMIDYMQVVNETFQTSHLIEKSKDILLISYLWEPDADPLDYQIKLVEIISLPSLPENDLSQIRADWEIVVGKIQEGHAHEISSSDTLFLEACTKAASSKVRRKQPYSTIEAKPRAWALKSSFMTAMSNKLIENMQPIKRSASETSTPLIEIVRNRFIPYFGRTEQELGKHFGYVKEGRRAPKNLCALITRRILGVSEDAKVEEFEKAGIAPKTMRLKRNGMPKEHVSFPCFDYFELAQTPFEESDFAASINQKYLLVIYREDAEGIYRLADVLFWQMPEEDVKEAKRCYDKMRSNVIGGHAEIPVRSTENRCCHVRPHGRNRDDTLPTPQGSYVTKKSFWLNATYLKDEIERILANEDSMRKPRTIPHLNLDLS